MLSQTHVQKRPCKYHFVGQFEIAFPGFACPTRVKNAGQRMQTSMLSGVHAGFLVPGLLPPTSIFGMNQRDARRLAVRGENCLFWPLS